MITSSLSTVARVQPIVAAGGSASPASLKRMADESTWAEVRGSAGIPAFCETTVL